MFDAPHRLTTRSLILGLSPPCARTGTRPCARPDVVRRRRRTRSEPARDGRGDPALSGRTRPALHYPVAVTATVTFVDPIWRTLYVQDATGGVLVRLDGAADVRVGDRLQIDGVTDSGDPLPLVVAERVTQARDRPAAGRRALPAGPHAPVPRRRRARSTSPASSSASRPTRPGHLIAELVAFDGTPFRLTVAGHWQQPLPQTLVNAQVRVTGVLARLVQPEPQTRGAAPARARPRRDHRHPAGRRPIPSTPSRPNAGRSSTWTPGGRAAPRARPRLRHASPPSAHVFLEGDRGAFRVDLDPGAGTSRRSAWRSKPAGFVSARRHADPPLRPAPRHRRAAAPGAGRGGRPLAHLLRDDAAGRLTRTSAFVRRVAREGPGTAPHARRRRRRADGHRAARRQAGRSRSPRAAASSSPASPSASTRVPPTRGAAARGPPVARAASTTSSVIAARRSSRAPRSPPAACCCSPCSARWPGRRTSGASAAPPTPGSRAAASRKRCSPASTTS